MAKTWDDFFVAALSTASSSHLTADDVSLRAAQIADRAYLIYSKRTSQSEEPKTKPRADSAEIRPLPPNPPNY